MLENYGRLASLKVLYVTRCKMSICSCYFPFPLLGMLINKKAFLQGLMRHLQSN